MKRFALPAFLLSLAIPFCTLAQEAVTDAPAELSQADVQEQNQLSDPNLIETAADSIDAWAEAVREQLGLEQWGETQGKIFLFKSHPAALKSTDPEFGTSLATAFDQAMTDIQLELVELRFGHLAMEKVREFMNDRSTNNREFPPVESTTESMDKVMSLFNKSLDVASAKLDAELVKLGASTAEVQAMTPVQKKSLFREKFIKNILKTASGDVSGAFPVQTAVKIDARGNAMVGVVAVQSQKTIQVAKDISMQRTSLIQGKGRKLKEMCPRKVEHMLGDLGTRLVYDEDGTPVIVAFAVSSFVPDGDDDYINARVREDVKKKCIDQADSMIAEVVNGQLSSESQRSSGQDIDKYLEREVKVNAMTMEKVAKNMVDITKSRNRTTASLDLKGVSTLMPPKAFKLPNGQQMFCVVRCWTYSTLRAVKAFNETDYSRPSTQAPKAEQPAAKPGTYQGRKLNTVEDF